MNAFCPNLSNKKVKEEFEELVGIVGEDAAYYLWDANNGYSLDKAPNGADSKLFQSLLDNYNGDRKQAIIAKAKTYTDNFKNWFGDWQNPFAQFNKSKIIFGHPGIGKTYALEGKYKDHFIDWDVEYNKKRDKWIEEHSNTKKGTNEYKEARNEYLIYPERHPDYIKFLTIEWNRVKNKTKQENKKLLASPHILLKLFPNDFDYIINIERSDFINRNVKRGGKEYESRLWKEGIDKTISNITNIPIYTAQKEEYLSDLIDSVNNVSKVVDENGEPLVVYHGTLEHFDEFDFSKVGNTTGSGYYTDPITKEKILFDSSSAFFFTDNKYAANSYKNLAAYQLAINRKVFYNNLAAIFLNNTYLFKKLKGEDSQRQKDFIDNILSPVLGFNVRKEANAIVENNSTMSEETRKYYGDKFRKAAIEIDAVTKPDHISNMKVNLKRNIDDFNFIKNNKDAILNNVLIDRFKKMRVRITSGYGIRENGEVFTTLEYQNGKYYAVGIPRTVGMVPVTENNFESLLNEMRKGIQQNKESLVKEESNKVYNRGKILPVFLNIKNPLTHNYNNSAFPDVYLSPTEERGEDVFDASVKNDELVKKTKYPTAYIAARQVRKAKKENNDGVIYENVRDPYDMNSYGIFNPNQIKSIDNKGPFSTSNNNIYYNIINDASDNGVEIDTIERTNDKSIEHINKIIRRLQRKIPGLRVVMVSEKDIPTGINKNANAFVQNGVVYLIQGRVTSEIAVEEILHPLVFALSEDNNNLFDQMLSEAQKDFPKLLKQINEVYSDKNGFTEADRQQELVTQALSRYLHKQINKSKIRKILENIAAWITNVLQGKWSAISQNKSYDLSKLSKLTLKDLSKFIDKQDAVFKIKFDNTVRYSFTVDQHQQKINKLQKDILDNFDRLYRTYRSNINKSESRQKLQDEIFETIGELKQKQGYESMRLAIGFALQHLGTINDVGMHTNPKSIIGYLQKQEINNFDNVTPDILIDIYRNGIGFYKQLVKSFPVKTDQNITYEDRINISALNDTLSACENIWRNALIVVSDRIIDEQIDKLVDVTQNMKDRMKEVCKDWLHKNQMFGDISTFQRYTYNYGYSTNDVIKLAKFLISQSEFKAQEKYNNEIGDILEELNKHDTILKRIIPGNWQRVFMEYDNDGNPTGNFVRDLNYGQYNKDLEQFTDELNKRFIKKYGYTYIENDHGQIINSVTEELAEDEQWTSDENGIYRPRYYEYLNELEIWKSEHANRRYNLIYYQERMSVPYKDDQDNSSSVGHEGGHGLSPKALFKFNDIQKNINYYLDKCTDRKTGVSYIEDLSKEDLKKLDFWRNKLDYLSNPYNEDGTIKDEEDRKIAFELTAWQKWSNEYLDTEIDLDTFYEEAKRIEEECKQSGDNTKLYNFYKYNSTYGTNPDFIQQTIGQFEEEFENESVIVTRAKQIKSALQKLVRTNNNYYRNLSKFENNANFFVECAQTDQIIEDNRTKKTEEFAEIMSQNFTFQEIYYRDPRGFFLDKTTGEYYNPNDTSTNRNPITFLEYLQRKYFNDYKTLGIIPGLDESYYSHFDTLSDEEIMLKIEELFTYTKIIYIGGSYEIKRFPSSIFTIMYPKKSSFYNEKTKRDENTIIYIPKGRFSNKKNKWFGTFVNEDFDLNDSNGIQPKREYYDNSEAFNKIKKYKLERMYQLLTNAVAESAQRVAQGNSRYDYRLPQIEAGTFSNLSRLRWGNIWDTISYSILRFSKVQNTDTDMRVNSDYNKNPDGSVLTTIPRRFINRVEDPRFISSEIIAGTLAMIHMANNYEQKNKIVSTLQTLQQAMNPENRELEYEDTGKNSYNMYDSMMRQHVYEQSWQSLNKSNQQLSKSKIASMKFVTKMIGHNAWHLLAGNIKSAIVGFMDSLITLMREPFTGKYSTKKQLLKGFFMTLKAFPNIIANLENPIPNCKSIAIMRLHQIVKEDSESYNKLHRTRFHKFLVHSPMGIFTMFDYFNTMWLMHSYYNHVKLYNGNEIEKGFYTKSQFIYKFLDAGFTKKHALEEYKLASTTLWDAYEFKNHRAVVKPQYENILDDKTKTRIGTKIKQRAALINGTNPSNDIPEYKRNFFGRIIGALRSFIMQIHQHYIAGGHSFTPRYTEEELQYEIHGQNTKRIKNIKFKKYTDEDRQLMGGYNFDTGEMQDEVILACLRSLKMLILKAGDQLRTFYGGNKKHKELKMTPNERAGWLDLLSLISIISLLFYINIPVHKWASDVKETTGMTLNPIEWYKRDLYKTAIDNIAFLSLQNQFTKIDPSTVFEVIKNITVYHNAMKEKMEAAQVIWDFFVMDDAERNEEIKSGSYKGEKRYIKQFYRSSGIIDNLHTFFSYNGLRENRKFYYNTFGYLYKAFGIDLSNKAYKGYGGGYNEYGEYDYSDIADSYSDISDSYSSVTDSY